MALRPDWVIGTVTLTSGSKNFTIAGATLALGQWRVGDAIIRTGRMLIIDTMAANGLTGTLAENCPADAAGAAVPLRIRYQSEGSRDQAMVQALAAMVDQGLLPGLAGLAPAANQMPYLDLSGAAALTPLTPAARAMLAVAGAAGQERVPVLTDVGAATYRNVMLDRADFSNDTTLVNVRGAGSAALSRYGGYYTASSGVNVDNELPGSVGLYNTTLTGTPTWSGIANWWITTQQTFTGDASYQRAVGYSSAAFVIFGRHRVAGGAWTSWQPETAVGGSNANGQFVRLTDGTQICWKNAAVFTQGGSASVSHSWTFPVAFNNSYPVSISAVLPVNSGSYTGAIVPVSVGQFYRSIANPTTSTVVGFWRVAGTSWLSGDQITEVSLMIVGRWY